jgi:hypothetical protein
MHALVMNEPAPGPERTAVVREAGNGVTGLAAGQPVAAFMRGGVNVPG